MSSRDFFSGKFDNGEDKILIHEDTADGFTFHGWFSDQQADALYSHLTIMGGMARELTSTSCFFLMDLGAVGARQK